MAIASHYNTPLHRFHNCHLLLFVEFLGTVQLQIIRIQTSDPLGIAVISTSGYSYGSCSMLVMEIEYYIGLLMYLNFLAPLNTFTI